MKQLKLFYFLMLTLLGLVKPAMSFAQYINEKEARAIASSVFTKNAGKDNSIYRKKILKDESQDSYEIIEPHLELHRVVMSERGDKPCFYIFNQESQTKGFAIVSNQGQLLAHSDHGTFDYDNAPDPLKWILEQYKNILSKSQTQPYPEEKEEDIIAGKKSLYRESIKPLIGSEWQQSSPYNNLIREKYAESRDNNSRIYAGCTTIAMGQIMYYWKYPDRGVGKKNWTVGDKTFEVNFDEPINWNNIGATNDENNEDVSNLCYHIAASLDSEVEYGGTSADPRLIPHALYTYYDYDKSAIYYEWPGLSDEEMEDIAYNELKNNRPCVIWGRDEMFGGNGHSIVVEGYDAETNHFYLNMGWGSGNYNTYYALTVNNSYQEFTWYQGLVTRIMPNKKGQRFPQISAKNFSASGANSKMRVAANDNNGSRVCTFSAQLCSEDMDANIVTGVIAKDYVTGQEYLFEGSTLNLTQGIFQDVNINIELNKIEFNGYYKLRPVFRMADGSDWVTVGAFPENEDETEPVKRIGLDITDAKSLDLGEEVNFSLDCTTLAPGESVYIDYSLPISGVPVSFSSSDNSVISVDETGKITGHMSGEVTITAHCDNFDYNGNRLVKETTKVFTIKCEETNVDHQVEIIYLFPKYLETDDRIWIISHIWITPAYQTSDYRKKIEYVLGFFQDGKLVKQGHSWQEQNFSIYGGCQYNNLEYLSWHKDLADGEYELRLLYRIPGETPEGKYWIMPSKIEGTAKVFMTLEKGHASFRQINRHPCELRVDSVSMSHSKEVGMQSTFTVDIARTGSYDSDVGTSDVFFYVDNNYEGHEILNMRHNVSSSYVVRDFGYTYYFEPDHTGFYNIKIIDGQHHVIYEDNIEIEEPKNYQLRVNNAIFHHSTVPNTINEGIDVELEIENIGEYKYIGDIICRPVIDTGQEDRFWPPRFLLNIAPGEIVKQVLPLNVGFYFDYTETLVVKCYYTSNGKTALLWQSEKLTYIDPSTNGIEQVEQERSQKVYNMYGRLVGTSDKINELPRGIYIVGKKKKMVK